MPPSTTGSTADQSVRQSLTLLAATSQSVAATRVQKVSTRVGSSRCRRLMSGP